MMFRRYNIQVEKSTFNTSRCCFTIGTTRASVALYMAMRLHRRRAPPPYRADIRLHLAEIPAARRVLLRRASLPILDDQDHSVNADGGSSRSPYPPGIGVSAGQVITMDILQYLAGSAQP